MTPSSSAAASIPPQDLAGRRVVVGVSGGIAAFRAVDLCSQLRKAGAEVRVAMTPSAAKFVTSLTFEAICGRPAVTSVLDMDRSWEMDHIADARWAEAVVVAPATANILAKLAHGLADCPVSTLCLAYEGPLLLAPAMNTVMLLNPATQANLAALRARGAEIIDTEEGRLACGEVGLGRLAPTDRLMEAVRFALRSARDLEGMRALITAGPTREHFDPVRYITNASSGRMGFALAREAARRGAIVRLIAGPCELDPPLGVHCENVVTAAEMFAAAKKWLRETEYAIFAAAPADYRPASPSKVKVKKDDAKADLKVAPTDDIAAWAGKNRRPGQILMGFAAETHDGEARALEKLKKKKLDFIAWNDVSRSDIGFGAAENEALILGRLGQRHAIAKISKENVASAIWDFLVGESGLVAIRPTTGKRP